MKLHLPPVLLALLMLASLAVATPVFAQAKASYELLLSPLPLEKLDLPAAAALAALAADTGAKPSFLCLRATGKTTVGTGASVEGVPQAEECLGQRAVGGAGTRIVVTQLALSASGGCAAATWAKVAVKEEKRDTSAAQSLKELFKAVGQATPAGATNFTALVSGPRWCVNAESFTTTHARAKLTIAAMAGEDTKTEVASTTVLTGPTEHLFITGDALFKGAKELKWDSATKTLSAKEKSERLYVGVNWMVGDVLSRQNAGSTDRFVLKLSFLPTRKPFDSVGVGFGYRLSESVFTLDPSQGKDGGVMVFVGHFWTRADALDAAGSPITDGKRERSWRLGLSYSFDTLLGTLKK